METQVPVKPKTDSFVSVTEISGEEVSQEQIQRLCDRYYWAGDYCKDKDVVEIACGTGQGLGYLHALSRSLQAGDIDPQIVKIASDHYRERVDVQVIDALNMPFADNSKDVILLFEAIYYLPDVEKFIAEVSRVLRPGGQLLIATANKDLPDFNPSPYSFQYYGVKDLADLLVRHGFQCQFFGHTSVKEVGLVQKVLRPVKKFAVQWNLIPQTMEAKKILKRIVFGKLKKLPHEITADTVDYQPPTTITEVQPNTQYKVILCAAQKGAQTVTN